MRSFHPWTPVIFTDLINTYRPINISEFSFLLLLLLLLFSYMIYNLH